MTDAVPDVRGPGRWFSKGAKSRKTMRPEDTSPTKAARKLIYLLDHLRSGETGDEPTTGAPHSFPSRSTSETDCPDPHLGCRGEPAAAASTAGKLT